MLNFNRKTEYAILAVEHIARKEDLKQPITSAREISDSYKIPYPLLAKIMQALAAKGVVKAVHGTKGGYVLAKRPADISVADIVEIFDGRVAVADCFKEERITCPQWDGCHIKDPFYELNNKIHSLLTQTKVADLTHPKGSQPMPITPITMMKERS